MLSFKINLKRSIEEYSDLKMEFPMYIEEYVSEMKRKKKRLQ